MKKKNRNSGAAGVRWRLSDLYSGVRDPAIQSDLDNLSKEAIGFERRYRGALPGRLREPGFLSDRMKELERIYERLDKIIAHAYLVFAGNSDRPAHGKYLQKVNEASTEIRNHLLFFILDWIALPDSSAEEALSSPFLRTFRHYLRKERAFRPHRLPEGEEKLLDLKNDTGSDAFMRLFDETMSRIRFRMVYKGKTTRLAEQEILSLLHDPDRAKRKAAAEGMTSGLKENQHLLTFILNTLVADHATEDRVRSFADPMSARHLSNEIEPEAVSAMMSAVERRVPLVSRYYRLKKRMMKLKTLMDYDRYAPLGKSRKKISWNEGKSIVLAAFREFSPRMESIASDFFTRRWIDAEIRPGKQGGAFSYGVVPSHHPYILMNYSGNVKDVMTLAHELGHGVHQVLSGSQGYFHMDTPLTMAETASVFAEMLVFHHLKAAEIDPRERFYLIASKCEEAFSTLFRQVVLTRFEERVHHRRRSEGELSVEQINRTWLEVNRPMFGKSLILTENYGWWWMYISHFIQSPFYCYAYAFGELLVLSLYQRYQKEGPAFAEKYLTLLASGGSDSPHNLLAPFKIDLLDGSFWEGGLDVLEAMVGEAEALSAERPR